MNIYEIERDTDFNQLFITQNEDLRPLKRAIVGEGKFTGPEPVELHENPIEIGKKSILMHNVDFVGGCLLLSEHAIETLGSLLSDNGYFIRTSSGTTLSYRIFICEREVDAIDQERSDLIRLPSGTIDEVLRYEFLEDLLAGLDIFRLRHRRARLFVSDRFKQAVEAESRLTGFIFRPLWSSQSGGVQYPPFRMNVYEDVPGTLARQRRAKRNAMRERIAREGHWPDNA